jgi:hypothetical protein
LLLFSNERLHFKLESFHTVSWKDFRRHDSIHNSVWATQRATSWGATSSTAGRLAANLRLMVADMASRVFRPRGRPNATIHYYRR